MFNLFKQKVDAKQFGLQLLTNVADFLYPDADRALAGCFSEYDMSNTPREFLKSSGIADRSLALNRYFHMHFAIQGASAAFGEKGREGISVGAMSVFKPVDGYDPKSVASLFEGVMTRGALYSKPYDHLGNPAAVLEWQPEGFKDVAIKCSRVIFALIISSVIESDEISQKMFDAHSLTLAASTATAYRAITNMQSKYQIVV